MGDDDGDGQDDYHYVYGISDCYVQMSEALFYGREESVWPWQE